MKKQDLITALEAVRPGLSNKETIEQATHFAFTGGRVITYNDEISISHPIEDFDIEGAVKAEELYKFLNKVNDDDIDVKLAKGEIRLSCGRSKAGLTLQEEIKLPFGEAGERDDWYGLPEDVLKAMHFCMFSCSKDMSKPVLSCVNVDKQGKVESSDDLRITQVDIDFLPVNTFLIPATSVRELSKYNPTHIAEGKGWVHFKTEEGTVFSCRVFDDNFPEVGHFFGTVGKQIKIPSTTTDVLERASIFSKRDHPLDELVQVEFEKNRMKIRAEGGVGWFEEEVNVKFRDDPVAFHINPSFLHQMANHVNTCVLGNNVMEFTGGNWRHIVCLRTEED